MVRIRGIEPVVEETQRPARIRARFHVETHECAIVARPGQDVVHDRDAQLFRDVEPHGGELDRHIGIDPPLVDPIEHVEVFLPRAARFGLGMDALAQKIE